MQWSDRCWQGGYWQGEDRCHAWVHNNYTTTIKNKKKDKNKKIKYDDEILPCRWSILIRDSVQGVLKADE
jgi:hypothetical protein